MAGKSPVAKVGRILKPCKNYGYYCVLLCHKGKLKGVAVHKLVCSNFCGKQPNQHMQVRHLDGTRTNNFPANLVWGTVKENSMDRVKHGTMFRGESSPSAKFTQRVVNKLRKTYSKLKRGAKRSFLDRVANKHGVTWYAVHGICLGKGY